MKRQTQQENEWTVDENFLKIGCKMLAHRRGGSHVNVHPDSSPIKAKVCMDEQAGTAEKADVIL